MSMPNLPDILMITFDALRYDVAVQAWESEQTPYLRQLIPAGWEHRHSPATLRLLLMRIFCRFLADSVTAWQGSASLYVAVSWHATRLGRDHGLARATIIEGLQRKGYQTICIGGVSFFQSRHTVGKSLAKLL